MCQLSTVFPRGIGSATERLRCSGGRGRGSRDACAQKASIGSVFPFLVLHALRGTRDDEHCHFWGRCGRSQFVVPASAGKRRPPEGGTANQRPAPRNGRAEKGPKRQPAREMRGEESDFSTIGVILARKMHWMRRRPSPLDSHALNRLTPRLGPESSTSRKDTQQCY